MSNVVIKVEDLGKQYRLGSIGNGYLKDDIVRYISKLRGKEDPFLKIGEVNDRSTKGSSDYVWAIRDVNFEVRQGQVLGIIGKNGAGKSTLLKILSKVTKPSEGQIKLKGRIASLLEVGTGFHPELTGRENIFLNGAILGMTKAEIKSKFDEIVDFSGVERYIDTPVKRYSSGMYVRLAFAVAAFLEPEILIIDEVLAVGDAEFQRKCLGKMKDVSDKDGRTVLFVSHNMSAVSALCNKALFLKNGRVNDYGEVGDVVAGYLTDSNGHATGNVWVGEAGDEDVKLKSLRVIGADESAVDLPTDAEINVEMSFEVYSAVENVVLAVRLESYRGNLIAFSAQYDNTVSNHPTNFKPGSYTFKIRIPANSLAAGHYKLVPDIGIYNRKRIVGDEVSLDVSVVNTTGLGLKFLAGSELESIFRPSWEWAQI